VTLVELTPDRASTDVPVTTFAAEGIWERVDGDRGEGPGRDDASGR
jgi:hypothetical protein